MTQEDLAAQAGLVPKHISLIERGRLNMRITTMLNLAEGLRVSASELMDVAQAEHDGTVRESQASRLDGTVGSR